MNKEPEWSEVIEALLPGELRDFLIMVRNGEIKVAMKPQNTIDC